jgi:pimeloyl-ACP methyl ester carboxylesterase
MAQQYHWLMLRGLVREARHWGHLKDYFAGKLPAASMHTVDFPGLGTEIDRKSPSQMDAIVDDTRARHLQARVAAGIAPDAPWAIFAVSLGGMVALNWASRYPQDFARVVVVNTSAGNLSTPFQRFSWRNLGKVLRAMFTRDATHRERMLLSFTVNDPNIDLDAVARDWAQLPRATRTTLIRQMWAASRWKLPTTISVPVLVLASEADRLCNVQCGKNIAKHINAPLHLHPTAGHELPRDAPDWCIVMVQDWIASDSR